ncbi:MAG: hypothetical protein ACYTDY_19430, partial [Planctomycetota bacterium]
MTPRTTLSIVICLTLAATLLGPGCGESSGETDTKGPEATAKGAEKAHDAPPEEPAAKERPEAPDFTLPDLAGEEH